MKFKIQLTEGNVHRAQGGQELIITVSFRLFWRQQRVICLWISALLHSYNNENRICDQTASRSNRVRVKCGINQIDKQAQVQVRSQSRFIYNVTLLSDLLSWPLCQGMINSTDCMPCYYVSLRNYISDYQISLDFEYQLESTATENIVSEPQDWTREV